MEEKIFYKFKNINNYTFDSLCNRYFYFSTPSLLNDPVDCRIPVSYEASDENLKNWIKHLCAQAEYTNKFQNVFTNWTPDTVRYLLQTGNLELQKAVNGTIEKCHILSLTDTNTNIKMWTHKDYCKNFSGICIGYKSYKLQNEFQNYYIETTLYNPDRNPFHVFDDEKCYFLLKKMEYDNDRKHYFRPFVEQYSDDYVFPYMGKSQNNLNIIYNFYHKTRKWNYEHEYRGFYENFKKEDNSKVYYPDSILDSITFGKRCPIDIRNRVFEIMKTYSNFNEISFYEARPGWKNIKAAIHPIDKNYLESLK